MHAKSLQPCPTFCDPTDCSPPGSSVHEIPGQTTGVGCHLLLQVNLPDPGVEPGSLTSPALADRLFTTSAIWQAHKATLLQFLQI